VSEVSRGILEEEIKQGIVSAAHRRFQSEFEKIRGPEGYYDSARYYAPLKTSTKWATNGRLL
jgi:hypothetical protein